MTVTIPLAALVLLLLLLLMLGMSLGALITLICVIVAPKGESRGN